MYIQRSSFGKLSRGHGYLAARDIRQSASPILAVGHEQKKRGIVARLKLLLAAKYILRERRVFPLMITQLRVFNKTKAEISCIYYS